MQVTRTCIPLRLRRNAWRDLAEHVPLTLFHIWGHVAWNELGGVERRRSPATRTVARGRADGATLRAGKRDAHYARQHHNLPIKASGRYAKRTEKRSHGTDARQQEGCKRTQSRVSWGVARAYEPRWGAGTRHTITLLTRAGSLVAVAIEAVALHRRSGQRKSERAHAFPAPPAAVPPAAVPPAATPSAAAPSAARPPTAVVTRPTVASMPPPPPRPGASRAPPPPVPSAASTAGCVLRDCSSCGEPAFVSPTAAWDAARCTRCAGPAQDELDRVGCECRGEGKRDFCICGGRGRLVHGRGRGRGRGGASVARGAERGGSSGVGKRAYTCSRCGEPKKGHVC